MTDVDGPWEVGLDGNRVTVHASDLYLVPLSETEPRAPRARSNKSKETMASTAFHVGFERLSERPPADNAVFCGDASSVACRRGQGVHMYDVVQALRGQADYLRQHAQYSFVVFCIDGPSPYCKQLSLRGQVQFSTPQITEPAQISPVAANFAPYGGGEPYVVVLADGEADPAVFNNSVLDTYFRPKALAAPDAVGPHAIEDARLSPPPSPDAAPPSAEAAPPSAKRTRASSAPPSPDAAPPSPDAAPPPPPGMVAGIHELHVEEEVEMLQVDESTIDEADGARKRERGDGNGQSPPLSPNAAPPSPKRTRASSAAPSPSPPGMVAGGHELHVEEQVETLPVGEADAARKRERGDEIGKLQNAATSPPPSPSAAPPSGKRTRASSAPPSPPSSGILAGEHEPYEEQAQLLLVDEADGAPASSMSTPFMCTPAAQTSGGEHEEHEEKARSETDNVQTGALPDRKAVEQREDDVSDHGISEFVGKIIADLLIVVEQQIALKVLTYHVDVNDVDVFPNSAVLENRPHLIRQVAIKHVGTWRRIRETEQAVQARRQLFWTNVFLRGDSAIKVDPVELFPNLRQVGDDELELDDSEELEDALMLGWPSPFDIPDAALKQLASTRDFGAVIAALASYCQSFAGEEALAARTRSAEWIRAQSGNNADGDLNARRFMLRSSPTFATLARDTLDWTPEVMSWDNVPIEQRAKRGQIRL